MSSLTLESFREFIESSPQLFWQCDACGHFTYVNRAWEAALGRSRDEILQLGLGDFSCVHGGGTDFLAALAGEGRTRACTRSCVTKSGATIYLSFTAAPIRDARGALVGACGVASDISGRRLTEEKLRQSEAHHRYISDNADDVIWSMDVATRRYTYCSPSVFRLRGFTAEEVMQQRLEDGLTPESAALAMTLLEQSVAARRPGDTSAFRFISQVDQICKDGSTVPTEVVVSLIFDPDGRPRELTGVTRDLTERRLAEQKLKETEEALARADKLEALGVLAGGIAHDFNNLLAGLFGYIDLTRRNVSAASKAAEYLEGALGAFERARDLTRQLLTFSRGGEPVRRPGQVGKVLMDSTNFALSGSSVACELRIADDLRPCDFDANQIAQVIDNLVINAKEAMNDAGRLEVSARNVRLQEGEQGTLPAGRYVKIDVRDWGTGIPADVLKKIFDPFFTTKKTGNGLGLATCYSIMQKHNGAIDVRSEVGKGSTFSLFIPCSAQAEDVNGDASEAMHQGGGTAIVLDDHELVRRVLSGVLGHMGYSVVQAKRGEDVLAALDQITSEGGRVALAILDLTVPGAMGGLETVTRLRSRYPDLPVFASSGYFDDPIMARPTDFGFTDSLRKPFLHHELSALLARNLPARK